MGERRKNERRETMLVNSIEVTSFIKVCQMRRGTASRFAPRRIPDARRPVPLHSCSKINNTRRRNDMCREKC